MRWVWMVGVTFPCATPGRAQVPQPPVVLEAPSGSRVGGLNGAGVALVGDAGAVFLNPAGLATIRHVAIEGSYRAVPLGASLTSAALGWRLGQFDVGFGGRMLREGQVSGRRPWDGLAVGSLVYRWGMVAVGTSGKYLRRERDGGRTYAVSGDVGLAVAVFDILAFAFAVQNIGGNWQDTSSLMLPKVTRLGFTMNYTDPQGALRLLSTVEMQWRQGLAARGILGLEAGVVVGAVGVLARAGYAGREDYIASGKFTVGATVSLGWLDLDYAYRPDDIGGEIAHVFGLRMRR